jgi:RNA polymerase sigma-54 factor
MEMKFGLHLKQRQQLVMTPKLQQALKLLQMPAIELQQMLKQEIMENPLLEEVDELDEVQDERTAEEEKTEEEEEKAELDSSADGEAGEEKIDWDEYLNDGFEIGGLAEERQEEFFEKVSPRGQTQLYRPVDQPVEDRHRRRADGCHRRLHYR